MFKSRRVRALVLGAVVASLPVSNYLAVMSPVAFGQATPASPATKPAKPLQTFAQVKSKADRVLSPLSAVAMWQAFIEQEGLPPEEKEKGEAELQIWTDRDADDAVIIKKKWVGGKEKEQIVQKVEDLISEARKMIEGNKEAGGSGQTLSAVEKLEEAAKIWPENFQVQFYLGFIALRKQDFKQALVQFEACKRIAPQSVAVLNNLGVAYLIQRPMPKFENAINAFYEASKYGDTKELAENFVFAFSIAPQGMQKAIRLKPQRDAMNLLASKYNVSKGNISLMTPGQEGIDGNDKGQREAKGIVGSGSGFLITEDGLILTNKHVAGMGNAVMVKFMDGTQKTGEIVVLDDEQDLALIRVKSDKPLPYVKIGKNDNPPDGSLAVIMGYPAPERFGYAVKTTSGTVATGNNSKATSDVTLDARVNPGNSGGPVYDQYGNVMAIIAQKTRPDGSITDTYGLAISNGRIRKFLAKNNITLEVGTDLPTPLKIEEIAERNRLATVCILGVKN